MTTSSRLNRKFRRLTLFLPPSAFGAHLDTTTTRPAEVFSLSSRTGGEGWGEEVNFIECPSPRPSPHSFLAGRGRRFLVVASRCARAFAVLLFWMALVRVNSQNPPAAPEKKAATNAAAAAKPANTNAPTDATTQPTGVAGAIPVNDSPAKAEQDAGSSSDGIQLSFQGANIEMVVQWLAQTTGKSVVKHPMVQCQLTIVSSRPGPGGFHGHRIQQIHHDRS